MMQKSFMKEFHNSYLLKSITSSPLCLINTTFGFLNAAAATAKSLQSCPTLCYPIDSSPPDSPIPGILQARTLEWVAISFSNAWKWKVKGKSLSCVWRSATPWTAAYQPPLSMDFPGKSTGVGAIAFSILKAGKLLKIGKVYWWWSQLCRQLVKPGGFFKLIFNWSIVVLQCF